MKSKKILITIGDPAGCGPRIAVSAIRSLLRTGVDFYLAGDLLILEKIPGFKTIRDSIVLIDSQTGGIGRLEIGKPSRLSGRAALNYLHTGLRFMAEENINRMVTAPVSKEAVSLIQPKFTGHTEFFAEYFKVKNVEMMMVCPGSKIVLFTRHVPLFTVSKLITRNALIKTIELTAITLKKSFGIENPKIALSSINPHAGVNTFLGKEEKIMISVAYKYKKMVFGPYPGDTIFTPNNITRYDCVISAYHDQGMIAFKLLAMKTGVNLTIGLPIIRTSPAHGTAYDLILEKKEPFAGSMIAAIRLALKLKVKVKGEA